MKKFNVYMFTFLTAVFIFTCCPFPVQAEVATFGAAYLAKKGEASYKIGKKEEALHEFSKALLIDPSNKKALKYLKKMGFEKGIYTNAKTKVTEVSDLTAHINEYKAKAAKLKQERDALEAQFAGLQSERDNLHQSNLIKELEVDLLEEKVSQIKNVVKAKDHRQTEQLRQIESVFTERERALKEEKDKILQNIQSAKQPAALGSRSGQGVDLTEINQKFSRSLNESLVLEQELQDLNFRYHDLRTRMSDVYTHQEKLIHVMKDYLSMREDSLNNVRDRLVTKEVDLTTSRHRLWTQSDQLVSLTEAVDTYRGRIDERDTLILDKNKDLRFLSDKLKGTDLGLTFHIETIKEQQEKIADLKKELEEAQVQINEINELLNK